MNTCQKVIFVCQTQKNYWQKKYRFQDERLAVIYNGVNVQHFNREAVIGQSRPLKEKLELDGEGPVFCCIAGFRPEKGHEILIQAFEKVGRANRKAKLILVGDGPLKANVADQVRKANLENGVKFLGQLDDVRPVLAISDCAIIASTAVETFSIAMLEAMSMGIPLVATDIGGTAEAVLDGQTGLVVPPGDVEQLYEAMISMARDPIRMRRMGETAHDLVAEKFSLSEMIGNTGNCIRSVLTKDFGT